MHPYSGEALIAAYRYQTYNGVGGCFKNALVVKLGRCERHRNQSQLSIPFALVIVAPA